MKQRPRAGANLFFIEFIIVLFFFLIVSTICIRVFVYSHQITQTAEAVSHAQTLAAGIAEAIEGTDGSGQALLNFYPEGSLSADCLTLTFDRDFTPCNQAEAFYTLTAKFEQTDRYNQAAITVTDPDNDIIYELPVSFYRSLTKEEVLS